MPLKDTLIGSISSILWGFAVALSLIVSREIGALSYIIALFPLCGLIGLLSSKAKKEAGIDPTVFKNKSYLRGLFFIMHESLALFSLYYVSPENVPIVILINYLWPTLTIISSILFSGVRIHNYKAFVLGTSLVLTSLAYEIIGSKLADINIFARTEDSIAYLLTFIGAISWALYSALSRRSLEESGGGKSVKYYQLAFLGLFPLLIFFPPHHTEFPWFTLIIFALCVTIHFISYACWDHGIRKGDIVILSLTADFIPWISLAFTCLVHSIKINPHTIASAIILVIGAIITRFGTIPKRLTPDCTKT